MAGSEFKRVKIWSGWLRLSHAAVGLSTLFLLLTGWLIAESPSLAERAVEYHYIAASVLVFGLLVRTVLFFTGSEHERLHSLLPRGSEVNAMVQTLRHYLAFGRAPLPGWYAQNPFWKPFYLLVYMALVVLAVTGAMIPGTDVVYGFYLPSAHAWWAQPVLWFTVLHLAAVAWHDLKSGSVDVSAIINGYRIFEYRGRRGDEDIVQVITVDTLKKRG